MISSASHNPNWNEFRLCGGGAGAWARSCACYNWSESVVGPISLCGLMIRLLWSEMLIRSCEGKVVHCKLTGGALMFAAKEPWFLAGPVVRKWKSSQFAPQRRATVHPPLSVYPFNLIHLQWFVTPLHRGVCRWRSGGEAVSQKAVQSTVRKRLVLKKKKKKESVWIAPGAFPSHPSECRREASIPFFLLVKRDLSSPFFPFLHPLPRKWNQKLVWLLQVCFCRLLHRQSNKLFRWLQFFFLFFFCFLHCRRRGIG